MKHICGCGYLYVYFYILILLLSLHPAGKLGAPSSLAADAVIHSLNSDIRGAATMFRDLAVCTAKNRCFFQKELGCLYKYSDIIQNNTLSFKIF